MSIRSLFRWKNKPEYDKKRNRAGLVDLDRLKKDIEDDSKEVARKAKKEVTSHGTFLINIIKKIYVDIKGFLLNNNEKSKESVKQNISKLYEFVFGEPKAKENVIKLISKSSS